MGNFLKEYFSLSNLEQKGVITFILLIILVVLAPKFYQIFKKPEIQSSSEFENWVATFNIDQRKEVAIFEENKDIHLEKSEIKSAEISLIKPFNFNPNNSSKEELMLLGLKEKTAETLINFREKGGKFYQKEDFKKVYGISDEDYKRLEDYIIIPKDTTYQNDKSFKNVYEEKVKLVLDINLADSIDFIQLKGIGPAYSSRIIKYRKKLGGFVNKNQLLEVYGITDTLYQSIESFLELNANSIQKININTADFKTLIAHPYLDYNATNSILKYRTQNGNFENLEDLKLLYSLDEKTIEKIKPYLTVHE